ncbi:MAG: universal stress protein [Planctomycetaceae bacterium]
MNWLPQSSVVVPIDFSESSADALRTALELSADAGQIHVLHVLVPLDLVMPGSFAIAADEDQRLQAARDRLTSFVAEHQLAGCHVEVRLGDPGLDITDYAAEVKAGLIVIPSHGYHGVKRFLLGSVAERVLRHAHCDVLVLRRRDAE